MARATTPLDPLEPIQQAEEGNSIPAANRPWFSVGQVVQCVTFNSSYYLKQLLKTTGKHTTRKILDLLQRGEAIEYSIVGIEAHYALPTSMICNQCYLQNGQSHSGLTWRYKVLVKGVLDGKKVCVIPNVWISEQNFVPIAEIPFTPGTYYRDSRNHVYKCALLQGETAFVYVGHIKADESLSWDNHITPRRFTPWQRRSFQPYTLPEKIRY